MYGQQATDYGRYLTMKLLRKLAIIVASVGLMTGAVWPSPPPATVSNPYPTKVTGKDSVNRTDLTVDIKGTDLGIFVEGTDDDVLMLFGDTFGMGWGGHGVPDGNPPNDAWRSQVVARSKDHNLTNTVSIHSWSRYGGEMLYSAKINNQEITVVPTGAVTVGDRIYAALMSVHHWGPGGGTWSTNYNAWAYSDNNGETWAWAPGSYWNNLTGTNGGFNFQQNAFVKGGDGFVYVYGTPAGRKGFVRIGRVPENQILTMSAYEYWNGTVWQPQIANAAPTSIRSGELSVAYSEYLDKWVMLSTECAAAGTGVCEAVIRTAPSPEGPWSSGAIAASSSNGEIYAPSIHPWSAADPDEDSLYFNLSVWEWYNVYFFNTDLDLAP